MWLLLSLDLHVLVAFWIFQGFSVDEDCVYHCSKDNDTFHNQIPTPLMLSRYVLLFLDLFLSPNHQIRACFQGDRLLLHHHWRDRCVILDKKAL